MLGFQAQRGALRIDMSVFAGNRSIQATGGIKLNARFSRVDFHNAPRGGLINLRCQSQSLTLPLDHKVVIVSSPELQLLVVLIDP